MTRALRILLAFTILLLGITFFSTHASSGCGAQGIPHCAAEAFSMSSPGLPDAVAALPSVLAVSMAVVFLAFIYILRPVSSKPSAAFTWLAIPWTHRREKHFLPLASPHGD